MSDSWSVYMIQTEDGKIYTGITTQVERRFEDHIKGKNGAKFFRSTPPKKILSRVGGFNRSEALKIEYRIKRLSRQKKLELAVRATKRRLLDLLKTD